MTTPFIVPTNFRIIAHRGASGYAPEHTSAAFRLAADMGIREFEFDTQLSADGRVVLCHDETLKKYGHGDRKVEQMNWNELKQLDMGTWFSPSFRKERMLTLDELFEEYKDRVTYHIEIKGKAPGLPEQIRTIIQGHHLATSCVITSFSSDSLLSIQAMNCDLKLGWLVQENFTNNGISESEANGFLQICPHAETVSKELVDSAHERGLEVRAWGANGSKEKVIDLLRRVVEGDCDGVTLNWPDMLTHKNK